MTKDFCRQIDEKMLVEGYVAGKLKGDLLKKFEEHIEECEKHAQAVLLEKALKKGINEFARSEIKAKLKKRLEKQNDTRFIMLRYAAILLVAVISPLIIYYQFNVAPQNLQRMSNLSKEERVRDERMDTMEQEKKMTPAENESPSMEVIAGSGGTAPPTSIPKRTARKGTEIERDLQKESVEDAEIAFIPAEAASDKSHPEITQAKARPGPMISASSHSFNIPNHYAELQERTLRDSTDIIECIETHLDSAHLQDYFLLCNIQIIKSGEIGHVKVINASVRSDELEDCLRSIIKEWMVSTGDAITEIEYKISYQLLSKSDR